METKEPNLGKIKKYPKAPPQAVVDIINSYMQFVSPLSFIS